MILQAIQAKNFDEAKQLLQAGEKLDPSLNIYTKSQIFDTLLKEKQFEILQLLFKDNTIELDIYELDSFNNTIFDRILYSLNTDEDSLAFLDDFFSKVENINDEVAGSTLLSYFFGKEAPLAFISKLVDAGADINFKNNAEEGYLHQVAKTYTRNPELLISYIDFLIEQGLDINEGNVVEKTPLYQAIDLNRKEFIAPLLKAGADPNQESKEGKSCFYLAVAEKLDLETYQLLKEYASPDFDALNKDQVSMFFEYVRISYSGSEKELQLLAELLKDGADLYQINSYYGRETRPVDILAEKKSEILQTALTNGNIDINRQDDEGNTLLHKVCAYNVNYEAEKAKETYRKVKLLLENGADKNITNNKDQTALALASDDNLKIKTVELLMK
ncbi:ankyrin repeat domain-containing protein [Pedobacter xixiisoli]|uniref:Ankyrin repeat n=1 Tax=Pedobacter xixiisoli TaxID=1476464 RepID=A0A285ZNS4_9SPHI|nr:ankyrin repeat domain-containing protein [Pedobacter xixiisoli]SOD11306.1 Ankyrin repeat [Pedobacter xixiisoli]